MRPFSFFKNFLYAIFLPAGGIIAPFIFCVSLSFFDFYPFFRLISPGLWGFARFLVVLKVFVRQFSPGRRDCHAVHYLCFFKFFSIFILFFDHFLRAYGVLRVFCFSFYLLTVVSS